MESSAIAEQKLEEMLGQFAARQKVGERYRSDADFRSRIDGGDVTEALSDLGMELPSSIEARIVANTADTVHMVLPPDPNADLSEETLNAVAGGCSYGAWLQGQFHNYTVNLLQGTGNAGHGGSGGAA